MTRRLPDLSARPVRRILVIRLSAIGDVVMAAPIARGLRHLFPEAEIDWVVEPAGADVLRGNPFLHDIIVRDRRRSLQVRGVRKVAAFCSEIAEIRRGLRGPYDLAFDLQGLGRSALVARSSGAPIRIGRADAREGSRRLLTHCLPPPADWRRASQEHTDLLRHLGHSAPPMDLEIYPDASNRGKADALLSALPAAPSGFVSVAAATTRPFKHWNNAAFAESLDRLHADFGLQAVLHGARKDLPLVDDIAARCTAVKPLVVAGETTLRDAAEIFRRSRLTLAVDTGLLYIALATGCPSVALFGPNDSRRLLGERNAICLQRVTPWKGRSRGTAWRDDRAIDLNTPDDVLSAARALLDSVRTTR